MIATTSFKLFKALPVISRFHRITVQRCYSNSTKPISLEIPINKNLLSRANKDQSVRYEALVEEMNQLHEILNDSDSTLEDLVKEDLRKLNTKFLELQNDIIESLTRDEYSGVSQCYVEIKAGVGGQEAMLFAGELFQMYLKYIKWHGWLISSVEDDLSDLGGVKFAGITIKGLQCFKWLRHEAGVHRIQRVPRTERSGRIHTSTVAVGVLPIKHIEEIEIPEKDLKYDATTSSGPGGQHANVTETFIRVTHIPTNLQVYSQETRSAIENKKRALDRLRELLARRENELRYAEYQRMKKEQYGDAGRSEKIRTYNIVQDRLTDHRLHENLYNLKEFVKGEPERLHQLITKLDNVRKQRILKDVLGECK